jgi:hypothetical protein
VPDFPDIDLFSITIGPASSSADWPPHHHSASFAGENHSAVAKPPLVTFTTTCRVSIPPVGFQIFNIASESTQSEEDRYDGISRKEFHKMALSTTLTTITIAFTNRDLLLLSKITSQQLPFP